MEDLAGLNISDEERADMLAMLGAEDDEGPDSVTRGKSTTEDELQPEITKRRMHHIYPPKSFALKIPRSIFYYSVPPAPTPPAPNTRPGSLPSKKAHLSAKLDFAATGGLECQQQAEEMVRLMRRSVATYENKERERVHWGDGEESWDGIVEGNERVGAVEVRVDGEGRLLSREGDEDWMDVGGGFGRWVEED